MRPIPYRVREILTRTPSPHAADPRIASGMRRIVLWSTRCGRVRGIALRKMRREMPDHEFLKKIHDGVFAGPDERVLEDQCRSPVFVRVIEI